MSAPSDAAARPALLAADCANGDDSECVEIVVRFRGAVAAKLTRLVDGLEALATEAAARNGIALETPGASLALPAAPAPDEILDADEAAAILGVDRRRLLTLCRKGRIRFVKGLGAGYRFLRSHLLEDVAALSRSVLDRKRRAGP